MKEMLIKIQELFFERLETKNSWGKNEVKQLYAECEREVFLDNLQHSS